MLSETNDEIPCEARKAMDDAVRVLEETQAIRLNALEKVKKLVSASDFDNFMHENRAFFEVEKYFNGPRDRATKTKRMRKPFALKSTSKDKLHHSYLSSDKSDRKISSSIEPTLTPPSPYGSPSDSP